MTSWLRQGRGEDAVKVRPRGWRGSVSENDQRPFSRVSDGLCPGSGRKPSAVRRLVLGVEWRDSSPAGLQARSLFGSRVLRNS